MRPLRRFAADALPAFAMGDHASRPYRIEDLLRVMARLRHPDTGCA